MRLYSIFDTVSELWAPPFLQENDRSAMRSFEQLKAQNPSAAADVRLMFLGDWLPKELVPLVVYSSPVEVTVSSVMSEFENAQG